MRVLSNVLLPFILITVIGNILHAQSEFKRIGYIPFYKVKMVKSLDFEGLTHLNIAFANPDEYGNLHTKTYDYAPIVEKAHKHNVEVYISLAGGGLAKDLSEQWETLMNPSNRSWYISKIKDYVLINGEKDEKVVEYQDSLHEHFIYPCEINNGNYMPPKDLGYSIEMKENSVNKFSYPNGEYWKNN